MLRRSKFALTVVAVVVCSALSPLSVGAAAPPTGQISGTIVDLATGAGLAHATIHILDGEGVDRIAHTAADGTYLTPQIRTNTYLVCVEGDSATGGSSLGNYQDQCYHGVPWSGGTFDVPVSATWVPISAGAVTTGINFRLKPGGAVTGSATTADGGVPLAGAKVEVYSKAGVFRNNTVTGAQGHFRIGGLRSDDYVVCVKADDATGGTAPYGRVPVCNGNVQWNGYSLPHGATVVPVTAGAAVAGIHLAVVAAGAISGTVTARHGVHIVSIDPNGFDVTDPDGNYAGGPVTVTGTDYEITGLPPTTVGYTVCLRASYVTGGSQSTGFLSQCWDHVTTTEGEVPPSAKRVPIVAAQVATGIDFALERATSISGTVTSAATGRPLYDASVFISQANGDFVDSTTTSSDGTYQFIGVAPSTEGYVVCFDDSYSHPAEAPDGFQSECYDNVPLVGDGTPVGVHLIPVNPGASISGIDAQLEQAGAIAGAVYAGPGEPLGNVAVAVFSPDGSEVGDAYTNGNGSYIVRGLTGSTDGYSVCFDGSRAYPGSDGGFVSICRRSVPWDGDIFRLPAGTTPVPVVSGQTHRGVGVRLAAGGAITGHVTDSRDSSHTLDAEVKVFTPAGNLVAHTDAYLGDYAIDGLPASADGYVVCFEQYRYADQCYDDVAWDGTTVPTDATPVVLQAGAVHGGVDAAMVRTGH